MLVLVYSPLAQDARVLREVRWLSQRYDVTSAAFGRSPVPGVPHIELEDLPPYRPGLWRRLRYIARFLSRRFSSVTRANARDLAALARLDAGRWDVVVANDVATLPVAFALRPRHGVLADVHEYAPRQSEHSRIWRWTEAPYMRWLVRRWLTRADAVTTVSDGIAEAYRTQFGIVAEVITNAAPMRDIRPRPVAHPIRLVHSGIAAPQRRLELMIDALRLSSVDASLDLYLISDGTAYLDQLKARAAGDHRVRFVPPVAADDLAAALSDYDVGVSVLPPTTFNLAWCLPNKFFDYVQARLGIIIGPSPEMERSVREYGLGAVTADFTAKALAEVFDSLTPELVERWKHAADAAAYPLSAEPQLLQLQTLIDGMGYREP